MKAVLISSLMLVLLISSVSAYDIRGFYSKIGFKWQNKVAPTAPVKAPEAPVLACISGPMFQEDLNYINAHAAAQEAMDMFDDGYHTIYLNGPAFRGANAYTAYKDGNRIMWVKQGECGEDNHKYSTDLDIEQALNQPPNPVSIMARIKGVSVYQKLRIGIIATKYSLKHYNGPGAPNHDNAPGPQEAAQ